MKYVVARPFNRLCKIYIVEEGENVATPFESWALRDGKQILFATTKMHKVLQSQHIAGAYDKGAIYAFTYEELCEVLTSHLGPSDKSRYEIALKGSEEPAVIEANTPVDYLSKWPRIGYILWKTLVLIIKSAIKALNVLLFLVILPFIIKFINGFKK
jgi:hypothetical protein